MFDKNGQRIKQIGYGAMVLEGYYGQSDDNAAVETLTHAINQQMMIDTADAYGAGHNEELVCQAIKQASVAPFIATKFGIVYEEGEKGSQLDTGWGFPLTINGSKAYVQRAIDSCLRRLGVEQIDLLYAHYLDPNVALEETISAMAEAVAAGKVAAIGVSNVTAEEIERANNVHPIASVQYEYSLFRREAEREILPTVNRIGAALVAWSPLGAGFLTGNVNALEKDDFRNNNPKMQGDNFTSNLQRLEKIKSVAFDLGVSPAQLALAWLVAQGDNVLPIPGSRKITRIDENLQALNIKLSPDILTQLDNIAPIGAFKGATLV
uniref:aldo/keto reductase n=1 Tax=Thaumasiovibrio occultus TaxID=1891184 RepID=UPI000B34B480|nr:aldo/keto reductase [Thaumasiovibrio occultus]